MVIDSVDKLLDVLFNEIINDIFYGEGSENCDTNGLTEEDAKNASCRIAKMLEALDDDADYCLDFLDAYLRNYPDNDIAD